MKVCQTNDDFPPESAAKRLKPKKSGGRVRKPPKHETEPCVSEAHLRSVLEYISECIRDWKASFVVEKPICIEDLFKGDREAIRIFGILCRSTQRRKIFLEAGLKTHGTKRGRYRMIALPKDADLTQEHVESMLALVRSGSAVPEDTDCASDGSSPGSPRGSSSGRRTLSGLPLVRRSDANKRRRLSEDDDDTSGVRVGTPTGSDVSDEDFFFKQSATSVAEIESGAEALRNLRIFGAGEHTDGESEEESDEIEKQEAAHDRVDDASAFKPTGAAKRDASSSVENLRESSFAQLRTLATMMTKPGVPTFSLDLGLQKTKKEKGRKTPKGWSTSGCLSPSQDPSSRSSTSPSAKESNRMTLGMQSAAVLSPPRRQNLFDQQMYGKPMALDDAVLSRQRSYSQPGRTNSPAEASSRSDTSHFRVARNEHGELVYTEQSGESGILNKSERSSSIPEAQEEASQMWKDYAKSRWGEASNYRLAPGMSITPGLNRGVSLDMGRQMVSRREGYPTKSLLDAGSFGKGYSPAKNGLRRDGNLASGTLSPDICTSLSPGLSSKLSSNITPTLPVQLAPQLQLAFANGMRPGHSFQSLKDRNDSQPLLSTYGNWK